MIHLLVSLDEDEFPVGSSIAVSVGKENVGPAKWGFVKAIAAFGNLPIGTDGRCPGQLWFTPGTAPEVELDGQPVVFLKVAADQTAFPD